MRQGQMQRLAPPPVTCARLPPIRCTRLATCRASVACRRLGVPMLYRGDSNLLSAPHGWKRAFWAVKTAALLRQFDGFLSPGVRARQFLESFRVRDYRIFNVPNAVDNELFAST